MSIIDLVNKIHHTDCMEFMKKLPDLAIDLTLTDIPYGVVSRPTGGLRKFDKEEADIETFPIDNFVLEVMRITKGSIYIFCATEQVSEIRKIMAGQLTTRLCIWQKTNPSPVNGQYMWLSGVECCVYGRRKGATFNEFCKNSVWRYPLVRKKFHPTEKPLDLISYLVRVSSNPGDIVFDPCLGSGTTALAALNEGRQYLACELDDKFVNYARERINGASPRKNINLRNDERGGESLENSHNLPESPERILPILPPLPNPEERPPQE